MSSLTIVVTGTNISPFSASNFDDTLNGGYLIDPMAVPLSFFYPTSVFGGEIATVFTQEISGGYLSTYYGDLNLNTLILDGYYSFCDSEVTFDLSNFDETTSKIVKIIFDPDNGSAIRTINANISSDYVSISSNNIKSTYYPNTSYYTVYHPNFNIFYEDGKNVNIIVPLTSIQCGIFDFYKSKTILDSVPLDRNDANVLIFLNDRDNNEVSLSNIYTSKLFELVQPASAFAILPPPDFYINPVAPPPPPTPTPTPTPPPPINGLVTIVDGISLKEIQGGLLYRISDKSIIDFNNYQIYSFNGEELVPLSYDFLETFVNQVQIYKFNNDQIMRFP